MSFDISETLAPASDQLDAVDLLTGPRTFTVARVSEGPADQPVQVHLTEFDRPWRPGKSMRRVLAFCWGTDASVWVGRRVTLYCDPDVRFGKDKVGGTRIQAMSDIDGPKSVPLLVSRGKTSAYVVEPLAATQSEINVEACDSIPELREAWKYADPAQKARITARVKQIEAQALEDDARSDQRAEAEADDARDDHGALDA